MVARETYPTLGLPVLPKRARVAAALTAAAALGLSACGSDEKAAEDTASTGIVDQVSVTAGTDTKAPTISLEEKSVSASKTEVKTIKEGKGAPVGKDDIVVLDIALFNGKDGKAIEGSETYTSKPIAFDLGSEEMYDGLRNGILGQKVGSTSTAVVPPSEMFGSAGNQQLGISGTDSLVMVYDIKSVMLKEADGKAVAAKSGMPKVTYHADKPATFVIPKSDPPTSTKISTLVQGDGATVRKGDTVYVSYTGALWKNGKVFDSSKKEGRRPFPVTLGAGSVITAWDEQLVGTKVGDRILLVVPPKDGYGSTGSPDGSITKNDTIVFVIDVLGKV